MHQSTQHSPYELMFAQKPQLPVDQLLGNIAEEDGESSTTDWVAQHQEYLTSVYTSVRKHLEEAAAYRRRDDPDSVPILQPGTLVYCRNHLQGCHKTQDIWGSTHHEIVDCMDDIGTLYRVKPYGEEGPYRTMHRTELKLVPTGQSSASHPEPAVLLQEDERGEQGPGNSDAGNQLRVAIVHTRTNAQGLSSPHCLGLTLDHAPPCSEDVPTALSPANDIDPIGATPLNSAPANHTAGPELAQSITGAGPSIVQPLELRIDPDPIPSHRRSTRSTAGQHPKPFRLPQSARQALSGNLSEVNAIPTPFRPWL